MFPTTRYQEWGQTKEKGGRWYFAQIWIPTKTEISPPSELVRPLQLHPNLDISMQDFNWGWGLQYYCKMFKFFIVKSFINILREYFHTRRSKSRCFSIFLSSLNQSIKPATDPQIQWNWNQNDFKAVCFNFSYCLQIFVWPKLIIFQACCFSGFLLVEHLTCHCFALEKMLKASSHPSLWTCCTKSLEIAKLFWQFFCKTLLANCWQCCEQIFELNGLGWTCGQCPFPNYWLSFVQHVSRLLIQESYCVGTVRRF